jgi:hypothetical protein
MTALGATRSASGMELYPGIRELCGRTSLECFTVYGCTPVRVLTESHFRTENRFRWVLKTP